MGWDGRKRPGAFMVLVLALVAGACNGSGKPKALPTNSATSTPASSAQPTVATTTARPTTASSPTTGAPLTATGSSTSDALEYSAIAGWYDGSTGSSGVLYIRADGASRFRPPVQSLCTTPCSDTTAPILNEDISLNSLTSTGPGSYITTGRITGYSSTVPVSQAGVGGTVTLYISAKGDLTVGPPGADPDVLVKGPPPPGFSTTTLPTPTLGHLAGAFAHGSGFGQIRPSDFSNGGDPTGAVGSVVWNSWGTPTATGSGISDYVASNQSVSQGTQESVTVVAFDLGYCAGQYMYQRVDWYFPQHGQSFNAAESENICTGS